jgi:hypothetical protein
MIPTLRQAFNRRFRPEQYSALLAELTRATGAAPRFRVAETPCFLPAALVQQCAAIGTELTLKLLGDADYLRQAEQAIPAGFRMPGLGTHPHFMTADFGLVEQPDGSLRPTLVELQAFPSIYAYQAALCAAYRSAYQLEPGLQHFLGGHSEESYFEALRKTVLGSHEPESVILTEVTPLEQKTYPDFALTAARLGIELVDIAELHVERSPGHPARVFRRDRSGRLAPVERIYNRAIVDEIIAKRVALPFRYEEPLAVEWAGHPNWYFLLSKFSLPFLDHPAVPRAWFLDDWLGGQAPALPRERWILKPLFAFAGRGIQFAPSDEELRAIPADERRGWIMQERMHFAPTIATPYGPTQMELRVLYLWPDGGELEPVLTLTRLGRGKMMGVDHNRDQLWVGGSAAFYVDEGD